MRDYNFWTPYSCHYIPLAFSSLVFMVCCSTKKFVIIKSFSFLKIVPSHRATGQGLANYVCHKYWAGVFKVGHEGNLTGCPRQNGRWWLRLTPGGNKRDLRAEKNVLREKTVGLNSSHLIGNSQTYSTASFGKRMRTVCLDKTAACLFILVILRYRITIFSRLVYERRYKQHKVRLTR